MYIIRVYTLRIVHIYTLRSFFQTQLPCDSSHLRLRRLRPWPRLPPWPRPRPPRRAPPELGRGRHPPKIAGAPKEGSFICISLYTYMHII